jgi:6-pyruvoyl tetrahydropterin synthase/QueD family protein
MALQLSRTVRFCVNDPPAGSAVATDDGPRDNTFAAWPTMRGLGRYYELDVACRGEADPVTGYFINIKQIDRAVQIRQQYEFSAAHRLHVPGLSDEENRSVFGKCNNPAGHGHNYRLEVVVRVPIDDDGRTADAAAIDALVNEHAVERLDHKHLNTDVPEFAELNPSVENIVRVIWGMLDAPLAGLGGGLEELSVWETSKTVCTYRGPVSAGAAAEV